jgi:hypothetical protein
VDIKALVDTVNATRGDNILSTMELEQRNCLVLETKVKEQRLKDGEDNMKPTR